MDEVLDKIDKAILNILQEDSTASIKEIADKVGLSTTPTYERIKRMEKDGVITNYVALIARHKVGLNFVVYWHITLSSQSKKVIAEFEKAVLKMPEIAEVVSVSGNYSYMIKIITKDLRSYNQFAENAISSIPNISVFSSNIVFHEVKKVTSLRIT